MSMKLISLDEMTRLVEICKTLAMAPFYQKLGPGGVLAIYLTAREMGLPPMFCLNGGLHNIEGKVVLSGQLINMMLVNAGYEVNFIEMTKTACEIEFVYPGGKRRETFRYTVEDAKEAGYFGIQEIDPGTGKAFWKKKPKDNWIYHTLDMLFNRCITSGGRKFAPHVLGNSYGIGELDNDDYIKPVPVDFSSLKKENVATLREENHVKPAIEDQRVFAPELEIFKQKHNIVEGQPIYDYVVRIANQKKVNTELAMELAFKNEETFLKAFHDMQEKQAKREKIA